jgi:uncharacterized protein YndB with AHSA1/START domain
MEPVKEITLEKVYDASQESVWEAWTNPEQLKQWWGPKNVTIPQCEVDLRVGGRFYIVMEAGAAMGPYKGTLWPMEAQFTVVEPQSKLSYSGFAWTEGKKEETTIDQTTEILLFEEDGKTRVTVKASILKAGPGAGMAAEGMKYGFTEQLEKLGEFLGVK